MDDIAAMRMVRTKNNELIPYETITKDNHRHDFIHIKNYDLLEERANLQTWFMYNYPNIGRARSMEYKINLFFRDNSFTLENILLTRDGKSTAEKLRFDHPAVTFYKKVIKDIMDDKDPFEQYRVFYNTLPRVDE
ncbi:hypothetical protein OAG29_02265 [Planctomycetaceae bacterium]|nr:hypothetical protein [Planctomycetaceae bacterium]